jgi:hypothetical protein
MIEKRIVYFAQGARVGCDNDCRKAWGIQCRPRVYFDAGGSLVGIGTSTSDMQEIEEGTLPFLKRDEEVDPDNHAYIPDRLLGKAPTDLGTYEGGHGKPDWRPRTGEKMNKWCMRQCERCVMTTPGNSDGPLALPDMDTYRFNSPRTERLVRAMPFWDIALDRQVRKALGNGVYDKRDLILAPFFAKSDAYWKERFGSSPSGFPCGGTRNFKGLSLRALERLTRLGVASEGPWNNCPGNAAFLGFMRKHPSWTAHGYAVSPDRGDVRLTIEGLEKEGRVGTREGKAFREAFGRADEFEVGKRYARCWYD